MILLVHKKGKKVVRVLKDGNQLSVKACKCTDALWELAEKFPDELVAWCEESLLKQINFPAWNTIFHHNLIMASYAVHSTFLPPAIGYVDKLPFINVNREIKFPTWLMSSDVGGINAEVLLKFKNLFNGIKDFDFLLNSIAKIGQQNGLFCYSEPELINLKSVDIDYTANSLQTFKFIYSHYKGVWTYILLWCFIKYEKELPIIPFFSAFGSIKFFQEKVSLPKISSDFTHSEGFPESIDVIIPTIGRKKYLLQVLEDLSRQSLLPKKVIIVEQNPELHSKTQLPELNSREWPFTIIHKFIHQTGACNARNLALQETTSEWVFLSDDDQRIGGNLLKECLEKIKIYGIHAITTSYLQPGEDKVFKTTKQWGTFGAGNSIVSEKYAKNCDFRLLYEHGYGEDIDFGMQLRNNGCDIIYHPDLEILHLKAPVGGFRKKNLREWEKEDPMPKPSPTLMALAIKYYTPQQLKGFKTELFIRFYNNQPVKNPVKYLKMMDKRWKKSEVWAHKLLAENT